MSSWWSAPTQPHRVKLDNVESLRGKPSGVSMHSVLPGRRPWKPPKNDYPEATRMVHVVCRLGTLWVQIVVLYGYANGHSSFKARTNELLNHACEMVSMLPLPAIYVGDFNADVTTLDMFPRLEREGFVTLQQLHEQLHGCVMPHTCRDATTPDTAILHPQVAQLARKIEVNCDGYFDTHHVVMFDLEVPMEHVPVPRIRFPETWLGFGVTRADLELTMNSPEIPPPMAHDLQTWGQQLETVVDHAIRREAHQQPQLQLPPGLPKQCRGRCQPRKRVQCPMAPLAKSSRQGNFQPDHEPITFRSRTLLKQLRRIESLRRRSLKLGTFEQIWDVT